MEALPTGMEVQRDGALCEDGFFLSESEHEDADEDYVRVASEEDGEHEVQVMREMAVDEQQLAVETLPCATGGDSCNTVKHAYLSVKHVREE
jgi:hypothetical protein